MNDLPDQPAERGGAPLEGEVLRGDAQTGSAPRWRRSRVISVRLPRWLALLLAVLLTTLAVVIAYLAFSLLVVLLVAALLYQGCRRLFRAPR